MEISKGLFAACVFSGLLGGFYIGTIVASYVRDSAEKQWSKLTLAVTQELKEARKTHALMLVTIEVKHAMLPPKVLQFMAETACHIAGIDYEETKAGIKTE